ncbi:MAG: hypothetical protein Q8M98_05175 [Candidatus Cloacimonadaceae bacterium]|nr:hypothetical protein [Candidatus Cloacimonadaceae bacterium]
MSPHNCLKTIPFRSIGMLRYGRDFLKEKKMLDCFPTNCNTAHQTI